MASSPAGETEASGDAPHVSVVVVNFNGRDLLDPLFRGLQAQTYRNFGVLLVDNASTDGSVDRVRNRYPEVQLIASPDNLGFSGGNNLGIRSSEGRYLALLNNDAVPDPDWLAEMVAEAEADPTVAAVASKLLFFRPFLPLHLTVTTFRPSEQVAGSADSRDLGVLWDEESRFAGCGYHKPIFEQGFYGPERLGERVLRWSVGEASLLLPVENGRRSTELELRVAGGPAPGRSLGLRVGDRELGQVELGSELAEHRLPVPREVVERESFDVINNAGTDLDRFGRAADRGIHEPDRGQYDAARDVEAFCGAAVLLRRSALDRVGLFDDDFFMYYEDTDLSWRLRRHGYRLRYRPSSVVRHLHATSSVEYSPLFNFYTARNRVLMIAKNGTAATAVGAWGSEFLTTLRLLASWLRHPNRPHARQALRTRLQVQRSLLRQLPRAARKRLRRQPS